MFSFLAWQSFAECRSGAVQLLNSKIYDSTDVVLRVRQTEDVVFRPSDVLAPAPRRRSRLAPLPREDDYAGLMHHRVTLCRSLRMFRMYTVSPLPESLCGIAVQPRFARSHFSDSVNPFAVEVLGSISVLPCPCSPASMNACMGLGFSIVPQFGQYATPSLFSRCKRLSSHYGRTGIPRMLYQF